MQHLKCLLCILLMIVVPSTVLYPHTPAITVHVHETAQELLENNHLLSYDEILNFLENLENGNLEERCSENDLEQINIFLANLAVQGMLPGDTEENLALTSDIQDLLYGIANPYLYALDFNEGYILAPTLFNNQGQILLCKNWFSKKWDQTKEFVKKHKKAIIIGAAVVVAAVVVCAVAAASTAGVAAAATATKANSASREPVTSTKDEKQIESKQILPQIPTLLSSKTSLLQPALQEEIDSFKKTIISEQFLSNNKPGFFIEENGRVLGKALAHQSLENLSHHIPTQFSQEICDLKITENITTFGHEKINNAFAPSESFSLSNTQTDFSDNIYQLRAERALELHCYDQAVTDFDKAIELNPNKPENYLERATSHLKAGAYDRSLKDYQQYIEKKPLSLNYIVDFSLGFATGLPKGVIESGNQLCGFAADFVKHPINTAHEVGSAFSHLGKLALSKDWASISQAFAPEVCELITKWESLSPREQGELAGYAFGKHGADILIPGAAAKIFAKGAVGAKELASAYRAFKTAEKTLVFESLSASAGDLCKTTTASSKATNYFLSKTDTFKTAGKAINNTGLASALENSTAKILGNSYRALGEVSVPIKNVELANYLSKISEGNWVKIYEAGIKNGNKMEVHYFRNNTNGKVFDVKVKHNHFHQKEFKGLVE